MARPKKTRATPPADKPPETAAPENPPAVQPTGAPAEPKTTRTPVPPSKETPPRRGPGRPPGARNKKAVEKLKVEREELHQAWAKKGEVVAKAGGKVLDGLSAYLGRVIGPDAELTADEKHSLGVGIGTVIAKYEPQWSDEWREELALAFTVVMIVGARVVVYLQKSEDEKAREVKAKTVATGPVSSPAPPAMDLRDAAKSTAK